MGDLAGRSLGILIPCYQESAKLLRTIWSIHQNLDLEAELVIQVEKQCVAKNRRAALSEFSGDLVIFMDDDVILPPFFASKMLSVLAARPEAGVISAIMTNPDGTRQNDVFCEPKQLLEVLPPGTCFCYSRERLGSCQFDAGYTGSQWEDTDFMVQVHEKGLKTYALGDVWVLHDNNWTGHTPKTWESNQKRFSKKWPNWGKAKGKD